MHIFRSGAGEAPAVIRAALAKALAFFYPQAGRIAKGEQPGVGRGRGPSRDPGGAGLLLPAGGEYRGGGAAGARERAYLETAERRWREGLVARERANLETAERRWWAGLAVRERAEKRAGTRRWRAGETAERRAGSDLPWNYANLPWLEIPLPRWLPREQGRERGERGRR
jgi:hypothetical protein